MEYNDPGQVRRNPGRPGGAGDIMSRKMNAAGRQEEEYEIEETPEAELEYQDRTLVLRKEPLPRKVQLMAAGVQEIRCLNCVRVKPIAGAEEVGDGWICADCLSGAGKKTAGGKAKQSR